MWVNRYYDLNLIKTLLETSCLIKASQNPLTKRQKQINHDPEVERREFWNQQTESPRLVNIYLKLCHPVI